MEAWSFIAIVQMFEALRQVRTATTALTIIAMKSKLKTFSPSTTNDRFIETMNPLFFNLSYNGQNLA